MTDATLDRIRILRGIGLRLRLRLRAGARRADARVGRGDGVGVGLGEAALEREGGNITRAAERLRITRHGLKKKMIRLGMRSPKVSGG